MKGAGANFLANPDSDMSVVMDDLEESVEHIVNSLVAVFPANAYPGNVFKNNARVAELVRDASI